MSYKGTSITSPLNPTGNFPAVWDEDLGGGYRIVSNQTELLAIPLEKIKYGMVVYVSADNKEYRYLNPITQNSQDTYTVLVQSNVITDWSEVIYGTNFTGNVIDVTYSQLKTLILNSDLLVGQFYRITNFNTTLYDAFDSPRIAYSGVEPLIVQALSETIVSMRAQSTISTDDIVLDISDLSPGHVLYGAPQYTGRIIYRRDNKNKLEAPYDFANVLIRKWAVDPIGGLNYDLPFPYQMFEVSGGPYSNISIDITPFGGSPITYLIAPQDGRYMNDIYDICSVLNSYFINNCEVVNGKICMYLIDFDNSLNPIYLYSNLKLFYPNSSFDLALNTINNYPGGANDNAYVFLTFNDNRTTISALPNSVRCSNIEIKPIVGIVYPTMVPRAQIGPPPRNPIPLTSILTSINLNPLGINNICFNNLSKNILTNSFNSIIDSSEKLTIYGYHNRIKNATSCNFQGASIIVDDIINSNIISDQIYILDGNKLEIISSSWIICQNIYNLFIRSAHVFNIPLGESDKVLDNKFSTFECTADITLGVDNIIVIPNEHYGIVRVDYSAVNITKIETMSKIYNVDFTLRAITADITLYGNSITTASIANTMILSSNQFTLLVLNESYIKFAYRERGGLINFIELETKTYI
jgi:hypothetical protein